MLDKVEGWKEEASCRGNIEASNLLSSSFVAC